MHRLFTRLYLHLLGMLAVVALVTVGVFATGFRTAWFRGFTERLVNHEARIVGDRWQDGAARDRLVRRLASDLELDFTLRDAEGRVLVAVGPELPPLDEEQQATANGGATTFTHRHRGWYAVAPVIDGSTGAFVGTVQAAPARRPPLRANLFRPALTLVLVLIIVAAATAPLARRMSRPIERLTAAMRRFGAGELAYRVPTAGGARRGRARSDELEQLTISWNEMAERIERLVRGQKELLANVSHELRSPLARIRVALELLPRDDKSEPRFRDLEGDLTDLDRLIDDVLTASRLEAGLTANREPVDVAALFETLCERAAVDPTTAGKDVRVAIDGDAVLVGDGALLKRALWNLIENAAKYGAAPITLGASARGGATILCVTDEGAGIAAADRERVLAPFVRLDRARTPASDGGQPRGFGLGLTIARRVAEAHGGRIVIGAPPDAGEGTRGFSISLELPEAPAA